MQNQKTPLHQGIQVLQRAWCNQFGHDMCCKRTTGKNAKHPYHQNYKAAIVCISVMVTNLKDLHGLERKNNFDGANLFVRSAQITKRDRKSTWNPSMQSYARMLLFFCFLSLIFLPSPEDNFHCLLHISILYKSNVAITSQFI